MVRVLSLLLIVSVFTAPLVAQPANPCPAEVQTQLAIGDSVDVLPGNTVNVRRLPSTSADLLGSLTSGDTIVITDGPQCTEGFVWWEIDRAGFIGWAAEGRTALDGSGALTQLFLYQEGILTPEADLNIAFDISSFASESSVTPWGPVERRPELFFPGYTLFRIEDYLDANPEERALFATRGLIAGLRVEPVDYYIDYVPAVRRELLELRELLTTRPTDISAGVPAPFTTFDDFERQAFAMMPTYIDFQNGSGIAFITAYIDDTTGGESLNILSYDFQALTDDGRYYINGDFAVFAPALDLIYERGETYEAYTARVVEQLQGLGPDDFVPSLTSLNAALATISVTGSDSSTEVAVEGMMEMTPEVTPEATPAG